MATKTIMTCDLCKNEMYKRYVDAIGVKIYKEKNDGCGMIIGDPIDLCQECHDKILEFANSLKVTKTTKEQENNVQ